MTPRGSLALLSLVAAACLACEDPEGSHQVGAALQAEQGESAETASTSSAPSRATPEEIARFAFAPTSFRAELMGRAVVVRLGRVGNDLSGSILDGTAEESVQGVVDSSGEVSLLVPSLGVFTGFIEGDGLSGAGPDGSPFWLQDRFRSVPSALPLGAALTLVPNVLHQHEGGASLTLVRPQLVGASAHLDDVNMWLRELSQPRGEDPAAPGDGERAAEADVSYEPRDLGRGAFGLEVSSYLYAGGAHGQTGLSCYIVDTITGEGAEGRSLLDPRKLAELSSVVTRRLQAENEGASLRSAGFFEDTVAISDSTALCAVAGGVRIVFQTYEVAPYAFGRPSVTLSSREAARFFTDHALTKTFLR